MLSNRICVVVERHFSLAHANSRCPSRGAAGISPPHLSVCRARRGREVPGLVQRTLRRRVGGGWELLLGALAAEPSALSRASAPACARQQHQGESAAHLHHTAHTNKKRASVCVAKSRVHLSCAGIIHLAARMEERRAEIFNRPSPRARRRFLLAEKFIKTLLVPSQAIICVIKKPLPG